MPKIAAPPPLDDVTWLRDVHEVRHSIDLAHPLFVHRADVAGGVAAQPSVPFPEKHPYCEFNFISKGESTQFICHEKVKRSPGTLMLLGPGTPHYALYHSYPQRGVTVHLLPILLFEMGPEEDGARVLGRFTAAQSIEDRVVKLPGPLAAKMAENFEQMAVESHGRQLGWELRLRALAVESLVAFMRWEKKAGRGPKSSQDQSNWLHIQKTLRYMHEHFSEPLYVQEVASAVGLTPSGLQAAFRRALGMSCVQYLKALRISHAKALLSSPDARVTEIALAVGFETLSHFNASFRDLIGMSPTEYIKSIHGKRG
jgi:AraC-like DNA-binding protein